MTTTRTRTEASLAAPVVRYLRRCGFRFSQQEVPFFEHRVDVYACNRKLKTTVAVELKLNNWKRALQQALLYQLCADLVFVALPSSSAHKVDRALFEKHGVGLITISDNNRCSQALKPAPSGVVKPHYRSVYFGLLTGRGHD